MRQLLQRKLDTEAFLSRRGHHFYSPLQYPDLVDRSFRKARLDESDKILEDSSRNDLPRISPPRERDDRGIKKGIEKAIISFSQFEGLRKANKDGN